MEGTVFNPRDTMSQLVDSNFSGITVKIDKGTSLARAAVAEVTVVNKSTVVNKAALREF